jgi:hypothetical protein
MRTTLDIDDELLATVKELARRRGCTTGQVVSAMLRKTLAVGGRSTSRRLPSACTGVSGFRPFPARSGVLVTDDHLTALREDAGD